MTATTTDATERADQQTSDAGHTVPTRRMSFEEAIEGLPKHFALDGNLILSHLAAAQSGTFPDGEDFFVRSVRRFRDQVTDPVLKRQVAGFIGQESVHGREHRVLNDTLRALGYPVDRFERRIRFTLRVQERFSSPLACLAQTAAAEHVTATLAELSLSNPEARGMFGPQVGQIFLWHALEESEHKAVAFDVYRAVGGSEELRVKMMRRVRIMFTATTAIQVLVSLLGDRDTYRRGALRSELATVPTLAGDASGDLAAAQGVRAARVPSQRPRHQRPGRDLAGRAVRRRGVDDPPAGVVGRVMRPRGRVARQRGDRRYTRMLRSVRRS